MSPKRTFHRVAFACGNSAKSLPPFRTSFRMLAAGALLLVSMAVSEISSACSVSISNLSQVIVNAETDNTYRLEGQLDITTPPETGTLAVRVEGGPSRIFTAPFSDPQPFVVQGLYADGANRDVTAVFSDVATCNGTASFTAPAGLGLVLGLGTNVDDFQIPFPNKDRSFDLVDPDNISSTGQVAGTIELNTPSPAPNDWGGYVSFCIQRDQPISVGPVYSDYMVRALETSPSAVGTGKAVLIPVGGIGPKKAGMVRYLFDQHYRGIDHSDYTDNQAAAFQLALWDISHDHYDGTPQNVVAAVSSTFRATNSASGARADAQAMLDQINNQNWSDTQWETYVSTDWHPVYLRSSAPENNQDLVIGVEVQSTPPTAVTMGEIALGGAEVDEFLDYIGTGSANADTLLGLLSTWDSAAAEDLSAADTDSLRKALRDYLDPDGDGHVAILRWETMEERGTIGFYVERRSGGADWVRINNTLLPGLITAPMGGEYWLADPGAQPGEEYEYRLIEQEARGELREYGPFRLHLSE